MKRLFKGVGFYLLIVIFIMLFARVLGQNPEPAKVLNMTELVDMLNKDEIKSINMEGQNWTGKLSDKSKFNAFVPKGLSDSMYEDYLKDKVDSGSLILSGSEEPGTPWILTIIPTILTLLVFGVIWFMFMQQSQGGGGKVMSFGKSRAKMHRDEGDIVTFADVAGLKEEKEELGEIVDFLREPRKFIELGARIPTGVLLVGPPGTGKTYLSRAVAGEAKVPFFTISGSDFVEMFVGVGASRVRDLFDQAKKNAPCIIFIDEIDAVGRRRGAGMGGGHDEREQTLNQLLVEMDGFSKNEGVIVMAATNRSDILDPALLRPGRFDRTVYVGLPDVKGREQILKVHTKNKPLDKDVDLKVIAKVTPGFSPADLENLVNEAAILTARNNLKAIPRTLIEEASIKVQAGPEKKSQVRSEEVNKLTAYHEAGHAITSRFTEGSDPVHMVTIIPRGMAGGFTAYIPKDDVSYMTKSKMKGKLVTLLGGRVAEALVLGDISTGAQNDLERATNIVKSMVTHYGMSDKLGSMTYGDDSEEVFMGRDFGRSRNYSETVATEIDNEMRKLIDEAYVKAETILNDNMEILHRVAQGLLVKETIDGEEFERLFKGETIEEIMASEPEVAEVVLEEKELEKEIEEKIVEEKTEEGKEEIGE